MSSFLSSLFGHTPQRVQAQEAIVGREDAIQVHPTHLVLGTSTLPPWEDKLDIIQLGMGCFWGAERKLWQQSGVHSTQVGYAGGYTKNPTYKEVCTGRTDHTEVVRVVFDPTQISLAQILKVFLENHDPTQGLRQGNDVGSQYRSAVYCYTPEQVAIVHQILEEFQASLHSKGYGGITTEVRRDVEFFYAEDYHQQYLYKNPNGYCGLRGTGVECRI